MLNSNYFSKSYFNLNLKVFNLWLQTNYGISFSENESFDKQLSYFYNYIRFLNNRERQIRANITPSKTNKPCTLISIIEIKLLDNLNITSYSTYSSK